MISTFYPTGVVGWCKVVFRWVPCSDGVEPTEKSSILTQPRRSSVTKKRSIQYWNQLLLAMAASLGYMTIGLVRGFSSSAVPSMQHLDPHLVPDEDAISWVSAIPPLGAFIGSLTAGPLLQSLGRKTTLMLSAPICTLGWILIALAQNYPMLLAARILTGFCAGVVTPSSQVYVAECSHAEIRGILGSLPALFMAGGILVSYALGAWLPWNHLAWASCIFPAILLFVLIPLPESPSWLIRRKRYAAADKALEWLHHEPRATADDIAMETRQNDVFTVADPPVEKPPDVVGKTAWKELLRRPVLLPFALTFMLLIFQQVSGIDAVIFYTVTIFEAAGSSINDHLAAVLVGLVQLVANFSALFLIDRTGRRPLLLFSGGLMCISMASLGTHFYLQVHNPEVSEQLGLLPLASLLVFMVGFSVGYCSIPFLLMGELIPEKQRSFLSSIAGSLNLGVMFVVIKTFPDLKGSIGTHGAFWLYSAFCFVSCLFVGFLVPETKGKSLDEIEEYFESKQRLRKEKKRKIREANASSNSE